MDYIERLYADRIGGKDFGEEKEIFKFERIKRAKRQAERDHPDLELIDLGVGEPDDMADLEIIEKLYESAKDWENRGYADNGIAEFKTAAAGYMKEVYGVQSLNPNTEILHVIGSKSAFSIIPQAFINQADVTLMTVPGYPIIGTITDWLGGEAYPMPLRKENGYFPDLSEIPITIRNKAKLMYLNYPNNPTGTAATREFFEEVVEFARENHILVIQDAAYGGLTFRQEPLSFLSVSGAKEVGIEVHSLSKAFNMTGWRLGFIAGNEKIVKAVAAVKDNYDSGQFKAIQKAGIYALEHPEITEQSCKKYERRHHKLSQVFRDCGFKAEVPAATFYEYIPIPKGTEDGLRFENAEAFSEHLIKTAKISTVPWDDAGAYVRISVTFHADTIEKEDAILEEIRKRLLKCRFSF